MKPLSPMQQSIYQYIATFTEDFGYPPSVREIGDAVGLRSPSTVHFHLKSLEAEGLIEKGAGKGRAIRLVQPMEDAQLSLEMPNQIPVLGSVAAGTPILAQELVEEYITFDTGGRSGEHFALNVRGDSMIEAGILDGDLVIVQQQQVARNGEIVVALLGDEATVKVFQKTGRQIWLMPCNPDYQPIDGNGCSILGKVVAVIRRY